MKFAVVLVGTILCLSGSAFGAETLQSYNVDTSRITVSGLSSGGAMAMQFHVAFSSEITGSGVYAGLPYACAKGGLTSANLCMYSPSTIIVSNLITEINNQANSGKIDATSNLSGSKVFVYHGTRDTTVNPTAGHKLQELYEHFGAVTETEYTLAAAHGYPTNFYGGACGSASSATHYINNCDYHGAYVGLNYLLGGSLNPPATSLGGRLIEYTQTEFGASALNSMDPVVVFWLILNDNQTQE